MEEKKRPVTNRTLNKSKGSLSSKKSGISNKKLNNNLVAVIRIHGQVKVSSDIKNTLYKLRLRRKYACVVVKPTKDILGMIKKIKYYVAYGEINKETLVKLLKARARKIDKNEFDAEKVADKITSSKSLKELGFKPFFRLHPPRKGIKSKLQYPKGVLGNNKKDINKLIERML